MSGLIWHQPELPTSITAVDGARVRLGGTWLDTSFWAFGGRHGLWSPSSITELDEGALDVLIQLEPDVILLGTGIRHQLAPPALHAHVMSAGIGFEAMSSDAAARTYNVLSGEGRAVLAAFLLPRQ